MAQHGVRLHLLHIGLPSPVVEVGVAVHEREPPLRFEARRTAADPVRAGDRDAHAQIGQMPVHLLIVVLHRLDDEGEKVLGRLLKGDRTRRRRQPAPLEPRRVARLQFRAVGFDEIRHVAEHLVLVGDLRQSDGRIVPVGEPRVGVHMRPDLRAKLLLQLDEARVEIRIGPRRVAEPLRRRHVVAGAEAPVREHVEIAVDALSLEAVDQIVQPLHTLRIELARRRQAIPLGELEDVRGGPVAVQLMEAHEVHAELREATGDLLAVVVGGEVRRAVEVRPPEAGLRAVLEDHLAAAAGQEAVLPGRLFAREQMAQVYGRVIPREAVGNGSTEAGLHGDPFSEFAGSSAMAASVFSVASTSSCPPWGETSLQYGLAL